MRSARINISVSILIFDIVVDILIVLEKIRQIRRCFVQSLPHLQIDRLQRLVGLCTIGIEVLLYTAICWQKRPHVPYQACFRMGQHSSLYLCVGNSSKSVICLSSECLIIFAVAPRIVPISASLRALCINFNTSIYYVFWKVFYL